MPTAAPRLEAARELARLSQALADALGAGDLDTAERIVAERGRLLDAALALAQPLPAEAASDLAAAAAAVREADARSQSTLIRAQEDTRAEQAALNQGARAMRAYLPVEPLAPGYVDRHD